MQGEYRIDLVKSGRTQSTMWRLLEHVLDMEGDMVTSDHVRDWLQQTTPCAHWQQDLGSDSYITIEFDNQEDLAEFVLKWL